MNKLYLLLLITACSSIMGGEESDTCNECQIDIYAVYQHFNALTLDENGFYHLAIDTNSWQTLHRLSGYLYRNGEGMNVTKMGWGSSHYWIIGDTLGYVVSYGLTDDLVYVGYDTTYITWFNGYEVPIVNGSSYSREDGEVNTMIAPIRTMRGDTATIFYGYHDNWTYEDTYGEFYVIFD